MKKRHERDCKGKDAVRYVILYTCLFMYEMVTGRKNDMEYMECDIPAAEGYCLDNDCPCAPARIERGEGYLYISPDVVRFRSDALTREQVRQKLAPLMQRGEYVPVSAYEPILVCEQAALRRGLDREVASADARQWWDSGSAPLRETPLATGFPVSEPPPVECDVQSECGAEKTFVPDETVFRFSPDSAGHGAESDELSAGDVAAQFASGPLAELAAKMARQEGTLSGGGTRFSDTNAGKTDARDMDSVETRIAAPVAQPEIPAAKRADNPEKGYKRKSGAKKRIILTALVLAILMAATAILFMKFRHDPTGIAAETIPRESAVAADEPLFVPLDTDAGAADDGKPAVPDMKQPEPPKSQPVLSLSFFEKAYSFRDSRCHGTIRFSGMTGAGGSYAQEVRFKGKEKTFSVGGACTFTADQIVFKPDGAATGIVWSLESLDDDGRTAVFFDPRADNRAQARIYLTQVSQPMGKEPGNQ